MKNSSTTSRTGARTTYSAAGFFLLRAPLLPARWLKDVVDAPATSRARGLLTLLDQPGVRTALTVSAPDLMAEIERSGLVDEGTRRDERRLGAVQRYLVRMSTRATPFGLLATVSGAQFGTHRWCSAPPTTFRCGPGKTWVSRTRRPGRDTSAWLATSGGGGTSSPSSREDGSTCPTPTCTEKADAAACECARANPSGSCEH